MIIALSVLLYMFIGRLVYHGVYKMYWFKNDMDDAESTVFSILWIVTLPIRATLHLFGLFIEYIFKDRRDL